jgi:hypothetical protein
MMVAIAAQIMQPSINGGLGQFNSLPISCLESNSKQGTLKEISPRLTIDFTHLLLISER